MIQHCEIIHKADGNGYCVVMNEYSIKYYIIKRWHPHLVKEVVFNGKRA